MREKATLLLLIASLGSALFTACGTVDSVGDIPNTVSDTTAASEADTTAAEGTAAAASTEASSEDVTEDATEDPTEAATEKSTEKKDDTTQAAQPPTQAAVHEPATDAPIQATEAPKPVGGTFGSDDMTFIYGSARAAMYTDAAGLVAALGTPSDVADAPGCLSNGADQRIYTYSGLTIYTYLQGEQSIIYEIEITSPSYSTADGLKVGMSVSDMEALYGTGYQKSGSYYTYSAGPEQELTIGVSGSSITSIDYYATV